MGNLVRQAHTMKWGPCFFIATAVLCGSCGPTVGALGPCDDVGKEGYVCTVPFELIFSHRDYLVGRLISVDGVLISGLSPEPADSTTPLYLLHSSFERARMCNPEVSIELIPTSRATQEALQRSSGWLVSVVGKLRVSKSGRWAELEVMQEPALGAGKKEEVSCLEPMPSEP